MVSVASRPICLPTAVDPVKEIFCTSGLRVTALPTVAPAPLTTFTTPDGRAALSKHSIRTWACRVLFWLGLMTTVQPAASAEAVFPAMNHGLPFHGVSSPATPTGTLVMIALPFFSSKFSGLSRSLASRKNWRACWLNMAENARGAPYSATVIAIRSSIRSSSASAICCRYALRSSSVVPDQVGNAALAAAIARSASTASPSTERPISSPVAGLCTSTVSRPCESVNCPPMKCRLTVFMTGLS
jgi:hypothetical protein